MKNKEFNKLDEINKIKNSLIKLYFYLKPNQNNNNENNNINSEKNLLKLDSLTLIKYIKNLFDINILFLVNEKIDEYQQSKENTQQEYEEILIKYENDIRNHIKTELELKLILEGLQIGCEELEKENIKLCKKLNIKRKKKFILNDYFDDKNEEEIFDDENDNNTNTNNTLTTENFQNKIKELNEIIKEYENELKNTKIILKSYENQVLQLSKNEQKLKNILLNKENEIIEFNIQIKELQKKINYYEENNKKKYNSNLNNSSKDIKNNSISNSFDFIEKYFKNKISNSKFNKNIFKNSFINYNRSSLVNIYNNNLNKNKNDNKKKRKKNRNNSLENTFVRNKKSTIFKEIFMNSNRSLKKNINEKVELINNINIYFKDNNNNNNNNSNNFFNSNFLYK
jgi:hypothetical protein